jgi:ABC-type sugar transport system ATPase subunit
MDAPEALYARPATLFVATFIGTMNRLEATLSGDGWLHGDPFRLRLPDPSSLQIPAGAPLVVGVRPEDLVLESAADGAETDGADAAVPASIEHVVDLGHYRRATVQAGPSRLLVFVPKGEPMPSDGVRLRPRRLLVYAGERLAGVVEPEAAASSSPVPARVPRRTVAG